MKDYKERSNGTKIDESTLCIAKGSNEVKTRYYISWTNTMSQDMEHSIMTWYTEEIQYGTPTENDNHE